MRLTVICLSHVSAVFSYVDVCTRAIWNARH